MSKTELVRNYVQKETKELKICKSVASCDTI